MKEIYLIAIVFLASQAAAYVIAGNESSTFEAENECPAADPCPPKLIYYEEDCSHYYECKNQEKILKTCKTGLYFSNKWQGCVQPENSECDNDDSGDDNSGDGGDSGDSGDSGDGGDGGDGGETECVNNGDLLPHECQCTKFYECKKTKMALRECPLGQIFDKAKKTCVPGKNCKAVGTECKDGDLINHECQCNKYYLCKNGLKALQVCEKGYYFDTDSSQCVKGTCPEDGKTCTKGEKKKHECHCEKYYACKNKDWIIKECKKGHHFSPTEQKCIKGGADECNSTPTSTTTPKPSGDPGDCPEGVPTLFRHECDCRLYYECIEGKKQLQICAWGKYFDYVNQVCEEAKKVIPKCQNTWDDWLSK